MTVRWLIVLSALTLAAGALALDGPADNRADKVRPVPPPGVAIPAADREELQKGVDALGKEIEDLRTALKDKPALLDLLPDVQIYYNAVRYPLKYNEFYDVKQVGTAKAFLKQGQERAKDLREGKSPWTTATGLLGAATSPRSMALCSPTASSCRNRSRRVRATSTGSICGVTAAMRL